MSPTPSLKVIAFANWENKTAGAIASRAGADRVRSLEGADADALLARRRRVADLYNREMEQWEHEVLTVGSSLWVWMTFTLLCEKLDLNGMHFGRGI